MAELHHPIHNVAMGIYADSEEWADIVPIAQDDGGLNPLAAISYTEDYSEAMSYLRAVMAMNEKSQRVLELTVDIIKMNPAHYTVWFGSIATNFCKDNLMLTQKSQAISSKCASFSAVRPLARARMAQ